MKTKVEHKNSELISILKKELGWHQARIKFLAGIITAMIKLQTVSFVRLSQGFESAARMESNLRRIQRFFAEFFISQDTIAKLLFTMLPDTGAHRLCLDRTNWKFGQTDINILMLSVAYQGVSFPIIWTLLPKGGNSNCQERAELMNRYLQLFGVKSISSLMADREFIGEDWFDELILEQIPFYIRLRENLWVNVPGKGNKKVFWLFNDLALNKPRYYDKLISYRGRYLFICGVKILNSKNKIEFVIIASYKRDYNALNEYKHRWQIETMFRAFKTSGFNIEQTHLQNIDRISKLISVVSIAFVWVYKVGIYLNNKIKKIEIKKHGRRAMSLFKYGLVFVAHALLNRNSTDYKICLKVLSCT
jgi:hypothetical protein